MNDKLLLFFAVACLIFLLASMAIQHSEVDDGDDS